jgi:hypothetical protein
VGYDSSRFPDPYRTRGDASHASVFLVALLLLIAVGYMLFSGTAWIFAPIESITGGTSLAASRSTSPQRTPVKPPATFVAPTIVPPLAGVPIPPTPTPTTPGAHPPGPIATAGAPANRVTPVAGAPPPVAPLLTPLPPTPGPPATGHVANTGGDGVYLRHTPHMADIWIAWHDNTKLTLLGAEADGDGQHWLQVRDPNNNVGWVPSQFVVRS